MLQLLQHNAVTAEERDVLPALLPLPAAVAVPLLEAVSLFSFASASLASAAAALRLRRPSVFEEAAPLLAVGGWGGSVRF